MDINPATPGHALIVPEAAFADITVIAAGRSRRRAATAQRLAVRVKDRLGAHGVNLLNSCGVAAWQTVFHFHVHVIPRYADDPARDPLVLPWQPTPGDMSAIAAAADMLRD